MRGAAARVVVRVRVAVGCQGQEYEAGLQVGAGAAMGTAASRRQGRGRGEDRGWGVDMTGWGVAESRKYRAESTQRRVGREREMWNIEEWTRVNVR